MKSTLTLATLAAVVAVGAAYAQQADQDSICEANYAANASIIAKAQAAASPAERKKILNDAIKANPNNALCIADLALQMSLNIEPAAGPETFGGETPTTTDGTPSPAENPSQLNQSSATGSASPVAPSVPVLPDLPIMMPMAQ